MHFRDIKITSNIEPCLTENARIILEKRYLVKDENGEVNETPADLFKRVAAFVASADIAYGTTEIEIQESANSFYELMARCQFLPNSPTLMNAGRPLGQLAACFVLPVQDSMDGIFDSLKHMALIHKSGGGTGFSFSNLRPKNDLVSSTAGISSGPVSFMNIFNTATETVKQGGTRRGANMAILRVDHPDILNFITAKENAGVLTNFNLSVALTDLFMESLEKDMDYDLINPRTGEKSGALKAKEVFDLIIEKAWSTGEPGIVFIDRINSANPLRKIGLIESTNPCGEQPLLPYESCNLGSINLNAVVVQEKGENSVDLGLLREITSIAVHFLDNVIDVNNYPLPEIREQTLANRKIGLGVMGFADLLIRMGIPYDSDSAVSMAGEIMRTIQEESKEASTRLAEKRGPFLNFQKSTYADQGMPPMRNSTTTTIAPTGTISIIAGCSSGIEPLFALAYVRNIMEGNRLVEMNPLFENYIKGEGINFEKVKNEFAEKGSVQNVDLVPEDLRRIFVTAHDIGPLWHVRLQAEFQKYVDNAVSKTVNFPEDATIDDIREVYQQAYKLGCKGVTVYRDRSRDAQVLNPGIAENEEQEDL